MTITTQVERAAEAVCRRLQEQSPQRLPDLRRGINPRHRMAFIDACALAVERGWAVRIKEDSLTLGEFRQESRQGVRLALADQLDEALRATREVDHG